MTVEEALKIAQDALDQGSLSKVQEIVFRQSWEGQSYQEIGNISGYELGYIRDVGCKLWQSLSKVLGKKVSKNNFQGVLKRQYSATRHARQACNRCSVLLQEEAQTQAIIPNVLIPPASTVKQYQDWGEAIDVSVFYGRVAELSILNRWIVQDRCRLVTLLGMGGIGKTALAVKLTQQVQNNFKYLIWRSLRNAPPIKDLLKDTILFLSHQQPVNLPETVDSQISWLMEYLRQYRCLLVLDNAETILRRGERVGRYRQNYEGYGQLLRRVADEPHQSCLLLTSREKPIGIAAKEGKTLPVRSLQLNGLPQADAREILKAKGLVITEDEASKLIHYYAGIPLALKIAASTVLSLFNGDVSRFLAQGTVIFGEIWELLDQQFNRLSAVEKQVMYCLVTNHEPLTLPKLLEEIEPTAVDRRELLEALISLQQRSLLPKGSIGFSQQPVLLEYMTERVNCCTH